VRMLCLITLLCACKNAWRLEACTAPKETISCAVQLPWRSLLHCRTFLGRQHCGAGLQS
jgi:hypothetical protein